MLQRGTMYWKRKKYVLETKVLRGRGCSFRTMPPLILSFNLFRAYSRYPTYLIFPNVLFKIPSNFFFTFHIQAVRYSRFSRFFSFKRFYLANVYKTAFVRNMDFLKRQDKVLINYSILIFEHYPYYFNHKQSVRYLELVFRLYVET